MARCLLDLGCPKQKVRVHHLGVEVDRIPFRFRTWDRRDPLRVLIAASFREKKGIPYALEALGHLHAEVSLEITIVGDASPESGSESEKGKILATIEKYCLQTKVRMLGYQPHSSLLEEVLKHHLFISPSVTADDGDTEGGAPVTLIEAAATGMPIISTTHCDIPEVISHGVSGLLAEERDVEGLITYLKWLIHHTDHWKGMGKAGRKRVETEYNARMQGEELACIYREVNES
jgi:colanic acid/amylovoran biosynthesis glycosyltransferase